MVDLKNKSILLISVSFFGYQNEIKNKLIEKGAFVDLYDERPSNYSWVKALIRINKNVLFFYIDSYYKEIILKTEKTHYDYILVVNCESIYPKHIKKLKKLHPSAMTILYLWDSIKNKKTAKELLPYFDKVYSFDMEDCTDYAMNYLNLFYIDSYKAIGMLKELRDIDVLFIGTIHSDRWKILNEIKEITDKYGYRNYFYLYLPNKLMYYYLRYIRKDVSSDRSNQFRYKTLSKCEISELFRRSNIVIDIQHPDQKGLTMRCFEVFGAKRKLITTNNEVKKFDFYNVNNFCIIDRNKITIPKNFFTSDYIEYSEDLYLKYSLENWVLKIFDQK